MDTAFDPSNYLREEPGYYSYPKTLTALQVINDDTVDIDGDSDFLIVGLVGKKTGDYKINWRTGQGRAIANQRLFDDNIVGIGRLPIKLPKPVIVPARGRLGVDITDVSNSSNTIEVVWVGLRLYRQAKPSA